MTHRRHIGRALALVLPLSLAACVAETTVAGGGGAGADGGAVGEADGSTTPDGFGGGDAGLGDDAGPGLDSGGGADGGGDAGAETGADTGLPPVCGNGVLEAPEICDDGNNFPGDGCNPTCSSDESCGNGIVDATESCDDGNLAGGDGCDPICQLEEGCGNGRVERGEQCDDGNLVAGDGCSDECVREVYVPVDSDGDGIADFDEGDGAVDTDGDDIPDTLDDDSDGDGIPDATEAGDADLGTLPVDSDDDGTPDFRDADSDDDLMPDAVEGTVDTDGDSTPDYIDPDSDADYVPDRVEGRVDSDGDGTPDCLDPDSDNDGVLDQHELLADSDGDGTSNRLDADSDNDGIPDSIEAGDADPGSYPVDTDGDGRPDYIDTDSDADGLGDASETGCPGSSDRLSPDSDGDGYSDLAEFLVGANRCAATSAVEFATYTDFFFILPNDGTVESAPLEFSSNIVQADVAINMDTTGSMGGEINNLRSSLSGSIVPGIRAEVPNVAFAVTRFDDFPCGGFGSGSDRPFALLQRATTNISAAQTAVNGLSATGGGDYYESGYEALYQIASGAGVSGCSASIPAFNPAAGRVAGEADGTIGGVGFRAGSFPVVIHITDAPSHDGSEYGGFAATRERTVSALQGIQARVISVVSGSDPRGQLESIARDTRATVRTCAWDGARPGGCGASQCCTGNGGAGRGADAGGTCPLVFDISDNGSGLNNAIVTAVRALVNTTTFTVTTTLRRDEDEFRATGVDTRCFIRRITPNRGVASGSCSTTPTIADINPADGTNDSFTNVTPGTALFFDVVAENAGCVEETDLPQAFTAYIDVVGDGLTVLDTQTVTIIVPAGSSNPSTVP